MTTETEKSPREVSVEIVGAHLSDKDVRFERMAADIEQALRYRDERAATICEGLVTFSPEHEKYTPADGAPCGWCDGLETAASAIRGKS